MPNVQTSLRNAVLSPVWHVTVEVTADDCSKVREAATKAAGLIYGNYDGVCFETVEGTQYFRPLSGSHGGEHRDVIGLPVRVLTFSIPREEEVLIRTIDAIVEAHSYEEPVIYVKEALATRVVPGAGKDNPNKWWNMGFAHYSELGRTRDEPGDDP